MKKINLLIWILLLIIPISIAQIPVINSYVVDNAGILSQNSKSQLENDLRGLESQTNGIQFVIFIENEYSKDYSLEEYTLKIAENNKIGKKGNDNGILLYVAVNDKKYRWEVGYGIESTLNSALLGRVSREYIVPNFQNGDYEKGILESEDVVKRLLLNSNDADIAALKNESASEPGIMGVIIFILILAFMVGIIFVSMKAAKKNPNYKKRNDGFYYGAAAGLFMGGLGRGRGGMGGFGGFSGGGGGFGGGGFSGGGW